MWVLVRMPSVLLQEPPSLAPCAQHQNREGGPNVGGSHQLARSWTNPYFLGTYTTGQCVNKKFYGLPAASKCVLCFNWTLTKQTGDPSLQRGPLECIAERVIEATLRPARMTSFNIEFHK